MNQYFEDYVWKNGVPKGLHPKKDEKLGLSYKIITDPYHKRYSLEKYLDQKFQEIIYDSALLDFRKLSPQDQMAWQRETVTETELAMTTLIRNMEDRVVLIEKYQFEKGLCRECSFFSPHGLQISTQRMYYTLLNDSFNGVILSDRQNYPCLIKKYAANEIGEFQELLEEHWDMSQLNRNIHNGENSFHR